MAKLEIPSIVVQSGSKSQVMDRSSSWFSMQQAFDDDSQPEESSTEENVLAQEASERELNASTTPTPPIAPAAVLTNAASPTNNNILPRSRSSKANLKLLKRSHAIKESTSPPPDILLSPVNPPTFITSSDLQLPVPVSMNNNNNSCMPNNNTGSLSNSSRPSIKREGSNQSIEMNWSAILSRGDSEHQYSDLCLSQIESFIINTLNKNTKDRMFLLRLENELVTFAKDPRKNSHKFGAMSSYQRMLVHRVAHYFGMEHNVDSTGQMVVINKTKFSRVPENKFNDFISDDILLSEEPRRSILKRDSASFEETVSFKSPDRHTADAPRRSKSFEEREEEYEKARRRIFQHPEQGDHSQDRQEDDIHWSQLESTWNSTDSSKLHPNRSSRLKKVESYESKDTLRANSLRSSVSKSHSFGGYEVSPNARVLTKQDSGSSVSSRVSPSSSGYKSQSQRSDATLSATPSPSATPHPHPHLTTQISSQSDALSPEPDPPEHTVVWAVTNMASVPPGSVLINPQTGHAYTNEDGTTYHYDPEHPPPGMYDTEPENVPRPTQNQNGGHVERSSNNHRRCPDVEQRSSEAEVPARPIKLPSAPSEPSGYHSNVQDLNGPPMLTLPGMMSQPGGVYTPLPPPMAVVTPQQMPIPGPTHYQTPYTELPNNPNGVYGSVPSNNPAFGPLQSTYDRLPFFEGPGCQDLCGYVMDLNLNREPPQRPIFYNPAPAHSVHPPPPPVTYTQVPPPPVPMFLAPTTAPGAPQRYYTPLQPDRPAECPYPQPPGHPYLSRCTSTPQLGVLVPSGTTPVMLPPTSMRSTYHRLPTPPSAQQYPMLSGGYPVIPSCYPHYQTVAAQPPPPPPQLTLPPMLRPTLQLGVCNSPPLRGPGVRGGRESAPGADTQHHSPTPTQLRFSNPHPHPYPVYPFSYPATNDVILLNSARNQFSSQGNNNRGVTTNASGRRHRSRGVGLGGSASQQQAALATAIEAAGLHQAQSGGYHSLRTP